MGEDENQRRDAAMKGFLLSSERLTLPKRIAGSLFVAALFTYATIYMLSALPWRPPRPWGIVITGGLFIAIFVWIFIATGGEPLDYPTEEAERELGLSKAEVRKLVADDWLDLARVHDRWQVTPKSIHEYAQYRRTGKLPSRRGLKRTVRKFDWIP